MKIRAALLLLLSLLGFSLPSIATTFVQMSDEALADQAPVIALVEVLSAEPAVAETPAVHFRVRLERLLKGDVAGDTLVVRVPGGRAASGKRLHIWGAPRFAEGDRALLFLAPRRDGTFGILHLMLGAFHELRAGGKRLALRDLSEAVELRHRPDGILEPGKSVERLREIEKFAAWLADRARGRRRAADYWESGSAPAFRPATDRFSFLNGVARRWFEFDTPGGGVDWLFHPAGLDGAGAGKSAFDVARGTWNAEPQTPIRLLDVGTSTASLGFLDFDGLNVILFGDPNHEMAGSFSCVGGGVLAIGGPWFDPTVVEDYKGQSFVPIAGADIVVNDGTLCFFAGHPERQEQVFAHELGHTLGLGHSCGDGSAGPCDTRDKSEALMRATAHVDGRGAVLEADDLAGIRFLYGAGGAAVEPPAAPGNLQAVALSSDQISLTWNDNSFAEASFHVEMEDGGGLFREVGVTEPDVTTLAIGGLSPGATYSFQVKARNEAGDSGWSNRASVATASGGGLAFAAPTNLRATALSSSAVRLTWDDNASNETDFRIEQAEQATSAGLFQQVTTVPANVTTTVLAGLTSGTSYEFRVRAGNASGVSEPAGPAAVTLPAAAGAAPLTREEVACEGSRLAGLLGRMEVRLPNSSKAVGLNLSLTRTGDFAGLAYSGNGPVTPEHHLAFSTNPEETTLLRNPARPQLFSFTLARNGLGTDLVSAGDINELRLRLNPTLDASAAADALVEIDNRNDPGAAVSTRPGRGLGSLLTPCHAGLPDRDIHVLRVLTKIVRAEAEGASHVEIALYRGEAEGTYRLDAYPLTAAGNPLGRLSADLAVTYDAAGALAGGTLRLLGRCAGAAATGCTSTTAPASLWLVRPVTSNETWNGAGTPEVSPEGPQESTVDWSGLLDGSTWRQPQ